MIFENLREKNCDWYALYNKEINNKKKTIKLYLDFGKSFFYHLGWPEKLNVKISFKLLFVDQLINYPIDEMVDTNLKTKLY